MDKKQAVRELANYYPLSDYEILYLLDYIAASGLPISTVINSIKY